MFDEILNALHGQAAPELMNKLGLDQQQATGSVNAAADSVKQVLSGGDGFGLDDVMNLFSSAKNTGGADGILSQFSSVLHGKLTNEVGLDASKASGVSSTIMPMITDLLTKHVGGNSGNLQSLIGSFAGANGGGIADMAKGMLGKLFS